MRALKSLRPSCFFYLSLVLTEELVSFLFVNLSLDMPRVFDAVLFMQKGTSIIMRRLREPEKVEYIYLFFPILTLMFMIRCISIFI